MRFVRESLGCGCPAEVFKHIERGRFLPMFSGLPVKETITVGGRLLVVLCSLPIEASALRNVLERGAQVRDANGLNRVRCVVPSSACAGLGIEAMQTPDKRLHVHAVADEDMPIEPSSDAFAYRP